MVNVIKCHNFLIKFKEVDFIGSSGFNLLVVAVVVLWSVYHPDACLSEVVGHCKLRVSVEAYVLVLDVAFLSVFSVVIHVSDVTSQLFGPI